MPLPALKELEPFPDQLRDNLTAFMEFLPGLPANNNNIGAVMNFIKDRHSWVHSELEAEHKWRIRIRERAGRRARGATTPAAPTEANIEVMIIERHWKSLESL